MKDRWGVLRVGRGMKLRLVAHGWDYKRNLLALDLGTTWVRVSFLFAGRSCWSTCAAPFKVIGADQIKIAVATLPDLRVILALQHGTSRYFFNPPNCFTQYRTKQQQAQT